LIVLLSAAEIALRGSGPGAAYSGAYIIYDTPIYRPHL